MYRFPARSKVIPFGNESVGSAAILVGCAKRPRGTRQIPAAAASGDRTATSRSPPWWRSIATPTVIPPRVGIVSVVWTPSGAMRRISLANARLT